ncbi:uncharacterized protein LOC128958429 [Oppia nitens]|uniref:uncharacterized protein LOC128958429 n=1 Tax=Oppia nitens TaxID=1686743 RepID=UPI0023DC1ECC|nr:uncharacterized protein LOC128958429 [Oppia nitens]
MLTSGYIAMTLLVVCTVVGGGQSLAVKQSIKFGNLTIGDNINNNNNKAAVGLNIKSQIDVEVKCTEGMEGYDCCIKIKDDAIKCASGKLRTPGEDEVKKWTADDIIKFSCCATTVLYDCIKDNAKAKCSSGDYDLYKKAYEETIKLLNEGQCSGHKINSDDVGYCSGTVTLLANIALIMISFVSVKLYLN